MARRPIRILAIFGVALLLLLAVGITFTIGWRPIIGPRARALTDRRFESTPARLKRGEYVVNSVAGCLGCHSDPDPSRPGLPPLATKLGAGSVWKDTDTPWVVAPNITPDKETGAGNWS